MPHSKVPGGQAASDKEIKKAAEKHGAGASNAAGHTELSKPGEAPVASDSGATNVGVNPGQNNPGEKGIDGKPVDPKPDSFGSSMK